MGPATRVVVSYPADVSDWGRGQLDTRHMRAYLRRHFETAREGDDWWVFLDVGCCGDSPDVPLRVESVEGGPAMDADTEIEYVEREACGVQTGWAVQSRAGPSRDA
jgi:hypothetical protein